MLSVFASFELDVCLLVPTETGYKKSIMDAHKGVRSYFESKGVHNYSNQDQGTKNKVIKSAYYVFADHLQETKASLYRPTSKDGDPRIWFYDLKKYAVPNNLLAIFLHQDSLYVINCSKEVIFDSISIPSTPLGLLASTLRPKKNDIALELYDKLKMISALGYVQTTIPGPTGIGMTLENLLNIKTDSDPTPDYKGIEIKSKRLGQAETRVNLFSHKPDWGLSPIDSAWNLLMDYGYVSKRDGKWRLSHQMNAVSPNSLGLALELDLKNDFLKLNHFDKDSVIKTHIATWEMKTLTDRLLKKHNETFWVYANKRGTGKTEEFHYITAKHTKSPIVDNFYSLILDGSIYHDLTLSIKNETKQTARDHGYLFKMWSEDVPALIPLVNTYDLTQA